MNTIVTIRTSVRGGLLAACIPALAAPVLAAPANSPATVAAARSARVTQALPAALRPVFYRALAKDAGAAYRINKDGCAELAKQGLKACFDNDGAHFTGATALSLHLVAWGRSGGLAAVTAVRSKISGNEVSYAHGDLTAWWRVLPLGFEQGFTIAQRPSGHGELTLMLGASRQDAGVLTIRHSRAGGNPVGKDIPTLGRDTSSYWIPASAGMTDKNNDNALAWGKLRYGKLVVTDADGKVVPATLTSKGGRVLIAVNDARVTYPLTVDPLVWIEQQKITASDGPPAGLFGSSVALDGTTALVGAGGAAYVFSEANGTWTQTAKLTPSDGVTGYGASVALDGTTALVGADATNNGQGAAYVFIESGGIWPPQETAKLTASDGAANDGFGISVALDGSTALIGAPQTFNSGPGAAYVFTESGGIWPPQETAKLTASDGAADDEFGISVALDGTTALVGAPQCDSFNLCVGPGAAYVFTESGGIWPPQETAKLTASDGASGDNFGVSVALDGTTALVGADATNNHPGAGYVFTESGGIWPPHEAAKLTASDGAVGDYFGNSVALDGTTALIGAYGATVNGHGKQGAAYVFSDAGGPWAQTAKLTASDGTAFDSFGASVALDSTLRVVGASQWWCLQELPICDNFEPGAAYFYGQSNLDLVISAPATVPRLQQYTSQTIVTNNDLLMTSPVVIVTIPVPNETSFVSATPGTCSLSAGVVTCNLGSVSGNGGTATANVTLTATGAPGGLNIVNLATTANVTPPLAALAFTQITCQVGYMTFTGTLGGNSWVQITSYNASHGQENAIFYAPAGFKYGVYLTYGSPPQTYTNSWLPTQQVHHWGPTGHYVWGGKGIIGALGTYALCLKHPL